MIFLQPWLLLGALGIGLPLAIHLLNKFKIPEMQWAAMQLLQQAVAAKSRRIKLEDILLLLLRCLAILLVVLAIARPVLESASSTVAQFTGEKTQGTVIAIDGAYGMAYHARISARFERAVKQARDVLKTVANGTRLTLLLMGQRPRLIYKSISCNIHEAEEALNKIEVLPEPPALEANLEFIHNALKEMNTPPMECFIATCAQKQSWGSLSEEAHKQIKEIGKLSSIYLLSSADDGTENLAVTRLRPVSGHLVKGGIVRFAADIWNPGTQAQRGVKVQLAMDDMVIDEKSIDIEPKQTVPVFLFARLKHSGTVRVTAKIEHDALDMDNARYAVIQVRESLKVLCVDGGVGLDKRIPESQFLAVAFTPNKAKAASSGLEVERATRLQFANLKLFDYQVIILANLPDLPPASVQSLHDYVEWGGGLIVFGGEQMNPKLANLGFTANGSPLLPVELTEAIGDAEKQDHPLAFEVTNDDPLSENLKVLPKELLAEPLFYRHYLLKLLPDAREILRFESSGGTLLAERAIGRGKVLFFNCTADDQWTNLPKTMMYPILLHQLVSDLTQQETSKPYTVNDALNVPLPPEIVTDQVVFTDPKGETTTIKVPQAEGRRVAVCPRAELPGFYTLQADLKKGAKSPTGDAPALKLAVNIDTRGSEVSCLQGDALASALKGLPIQTSENVTHTAQTVQQSRTGEEIWRPFLFAALLVFLLEYYVAYRFSRHKLVAASRAPETPSIETVSVAPPGFFQRFFRKGKANAAPVSDPTTETRIFEKEEAGV